MITDQKSVPIALFTACLMLPVTACAAITVTNTVYSSSETGGNTASGEAGSNGVAGKSGTVINGKSTNSVSVETMVNGAVVEQYVATSSGPIEYSHTDSASGVQVHVSAGAPIPSDIRTASRPAVRNSTATAATSSEYSIPIKPEAQSGVIAVFRSVEQLINRVFIYVFNRH